MNLEKIYNETGKTASLKPWLMAGGIGTGLGALHGIGDTKVNYYSDPFHEVTTGRALAGGVGGLGGLGTYKALRHMGRGRAFSGLAGLLAGGLTSYLTAPTDIKGFNPRKLPWETMK